MFEQIFKNIDDDEIRRKMEKIKGDNYDKK
jgi:hypothetical protein